MAQKTTPIRPFLKWPGGKRQLLPQIKKYIPEQFTTYYEPFIGGGAMLFYLQPKRFVINDLNQELINTYRVIRDEVENLILELGRSQCEAGHFYQLRCWDRISSYDKISRVRRAARMIFLNKTGYNGLYRVSRDGHFNVAYGREDGKEFLDARGLRAVSQYLKKTRGKIKHGHYSYALKGARRGSFVYLDPPYDSIGESAGFTSYTVYFGVSDPLISEYLTPMWISTA